MNDTPKPSYERPLIVRHQSGLMNKFSRVQAMQPKRTIDGVAVNELVEAYGSPLFVFSERTIQDRYRELRDAVARRYPSVRMAWSYKTNYLDGICKIFHREGAWAEVVSDFEYDKALNLGVPPQHIHFNGPFKPRDVLERALPAGTIVHIDHFDELALAEKVAAKHQIQPGVAIRINTAVSGLPQWSRFGFNLDNGQAQDAVARLMAGKRLRLIGIHCHLGTFITEPGAYKEAVQKMVRFANQIRRDHGVKLDFIDVGGGIASHNTLKAQYLPGEQATPSFTRYAEALADGLAGLDVPPAERPTLVLENGRALVDDAGYLIATVVANKRLPDGRRAVVVDAGVNLLFTSFWYRHDVVPAQSFQGMPEPTVIYGPLCMNIDVVRETLLFPPVDPGDRLIFHNVGAYNVTQWMQFITYRPAVALIGQESQHALLRTRENLDSILAHEKRPDWL